MKVAQKSKEEANKRLHKVGQVHAELLNQVVPLRAKVADLEDMEKASEAQQKKLEAHWVDREQKLGKTEGELAAKIEAFNLLHAENGKLQAYVSKLQVEKEFLDKQLPTQHSKIEVACEYLKRSEQMGALAAVCTPTIKSTSEKHQRDAPPYPNTVNGCSEGGLITE